MTGTRDTHPAVLAGLSGFVAASPAVAFAQTGSLASTEELLLQSGLGSFLMGCATGAAVAGAVCAVRAHARARAENDAQLEGTTQLSANREAPQGASRGSDTKSAAHNRDARHVAHPAQKTTAAASDDVVTRPDAVMGEWYVPQVSADDYEQLAENYVNRQTLSERMARRARGVAAVLSERLGAGRMDGVPVIERADGSVGDVGTSWWDAAVGDSVRVVGQTNGEMAIETPQEFGAMGAGTKKNQDKAPDAPTLAAAQGLAASQLTARRLASAQLAPSERAIRIARLVPPVEEGAFPERREIEEADAHDEWERAIRAMDERIEQSVVDDARARETEVTAAAAQEDPTSFILFRVPGGHPEVVDAESYVDYLIDDEFSRNSSQAARRQSKDYLRVIQGGSQRVRSRRPARSRAASTGADESAWHPKHLARPAQALDA